jgi:hypothetical protein
MLTGTDMRQKRNGQARSSAPAFLKFRQPPVLQTQRKSDEKGQIPVTFGHHLRHVLDTAENTLGVYFATCISFGTHYNHRLVIFLLANLSVAGRPQLIATLSFSAVKAQIDR